MLTQQQISSEELSDILAQFDLGEIKNIEPLPTSGNIAYVVRAASRSYFLRLCPPDGPRWRSRQEIEAELELINYLYVHDFPALAAVKNKSGRELISRGRSFGYLREFIEAEEKLNPSVEEVAKFGEILGWFHSLTENYQTKNRREHTFDLAATKQSWAASRAKILASDFEDKEKFVAQFEQAINLLNFPDALPRGMIHEDLGKRHVLWRGSGIVAVVDFDRSYFGQLVLDLGQAARGWCFTGNWRQWSQANFEALVGGYEKKRPLTALEKQVLSSAIRFGILERALSFCLRFIEVTQDGEDAEFAREGVFKQLELIEI